MNFSDLVDSMSQQTVLMADGKNERINSHYQGRQLDGNADVSRRNAQ